MKYILLILFTNPVNGTAMTTIEFGTKSQCEIAERQIKDIIIASKNIKTRCIETDNNYGV